jgi:hypothetical protein
MPPGAREIEIRRYRYDEDAGQLLDLYLPPGEALSPVLIVATVFSSSNLRAWFGRTLLDTLLYVGLGSALVAHGVATVVYEAEDPTVAFRRVMRYLDRHGRSLGLDTTRLGVYATSGNGEFATRLLAHPDYGPRIRVGVLFHANLSPTIFRSPDLACFVAWSPDGS